MNGPPDNISPAELWIRIQDLPRPARTVDFPATDADGEPLGKLKIWVLTAAERMSCSVDAEKFARKHLKDGKKDDLGYESVYADEVACQILVRACRDVNDINRPLFPSDDKLRQKLTSEQMSVLFTHYLTVQDELGPIVRTMSEAEVDMWIKRLAEGGGAVDPLDILHLDALRVLTSTMALRLHNSSTATSSAGTPPSETGSDSGPS